MYVWNYGIMTEFHEIIATTGSVLLFVSVYV